MTGLNWCRFVVWDNPVRLLSQPTQHYRWVPTFATNERVTALLSASGSEQAGLGHLPLANGLGPGRAQPMPMARGSWPSGGRDWAQLV